MELQSLVNDAVAHALKGTGFGTEFIEATAGKVHKHLGKTLNGTLLTAEQQAAVDSVLTNFGKRRAPRAAEAKSVPTAKPASRRVPGASAAAPASTGTGRRVPGATKAAKAAKPKVTKAAKPKAAKPKAAKPKAKAKGEKAPITPRKRCSMSWGRLVSAATRAEEAGSADEKQQALLQAIATQGNDAAFEVYFKGEWAANEAKKQAAKDRKAAKAAK